MLSNNDVKSHAPSKYCHIWLLLSYFSLVTVISADIVFCQLVVEFFATLRFFSICIFSFRGKVVYPVIDGLNSHSLVLSAIYV